MVVRCYEKGAAALPVCVLQVHGADAYETRDTRAKYDATDRKARDERYTEPKNNEIAPHMGHGRRLPK